MVQKTHGVITQWADIYKFVKYITTPIDDDHQQTISDTIIENMLLESDIEFPTYIASGVPNNAYSS